MRYDGKENTKHYVTPYLLRDLLLEYQQKTGFENSKPVLIIFLLLHLYLYVRHKHRSKDLDYLFVRMLYLLCFV